MVQRPSNKVLFLCVVLLNASAYYAFPTHDVPNNTSKKTLTNIWENNEEIQIFREYLRIPTVHPDVDYKPAVAFLQRQAAGLDLPMSVYYPVDKENPVVVMTWKGTEPELPSIMLNSHMDVVPVFPELWKHPPFEAVMEENGDIYGRGTQDMKSVGMQYLAAIRALKREGIDQFKRTIHVVFVPDEEVGGHGMVGFVKSNAFKLLNVGYVSDEGGSTLNDDGSLNVYYGERTLFQTEFIFHGQSGHGSKLLNDTPGVKLSYILEKMNDLRKEEERKLNELKYPYGNVTSINLTILKGGIQTNVIPAEMSATFDIRLSVNVDLDEFKEQFDRWCEEAGAGITVNYLYSGEKEKLTSIDDSINPFWTAYKTSFKEKGIQVVPAILTGATDSRFIRRLDIPAFGLTPLLTDQPRQHANNEYLNADTFLTGIEFFKKLIPNLANV